MKNNRKLFGLIAVAMVAMLAFAACGNGSTDPDPVQKKLTITGLTGLSGEAMVMLYPIAMAAEPTLGTKEEVPMGSTSFTFSLFEAVGSSEVPWTGSADVYVLLNFTDMGAFFVYTNGSSLAELGISDFMDDIAGNMEKLPKLAIIQDVTTVDMGKFKSIVVVP